MILLPPGSAGTRGLGLRQTHWEYTHQAALDHRCGIWGIGRAPLSPPGGRPTPAQDAVACRCAVRWVVHGTVLREPGPGSVSYLLSIRAHGGDPREGRGCSRCGSHPAGTTRSVSGGVQEAPWRLFSDPAEA